jgi:hypothetical protein
VHITDRVAAKPFAIYLVLIREARRLAQGAFDWRKERYEFVDDRLAIDLLLGRADLRPMIEAGAALADMEDLWSSAMTRFARDRDRVLLYPR